MPKGAYTQENEIKKKQPRFDHIHFAHPNEVSKTLLFFNVCVLVHVVCCVMFETGMGDSFHEFRFLSAAQQTDGDGQPLE